MYNNTELQLSHILVKREFSIGARICLSYAFILLLSCLRNMKHLILTGIVTLLTLSAFAQSSAEYDGIKAIKEIHDGWLVVRLPGFEKKMAAMDSLLDGNISEKARATLEREMENTLKEREFIHKWYPLMFAQTYTFSRLAFIYTQETGGFQNGTIAARSSDGTPIDSVYLANYFFATLNGVASSPFAFTSREHLLLSFPFPNNIALPGFIIPQITGAPMPDWIASLESDRNAVYRAYSHTKRVNRKLSKFYRKRYE